MRQFSLFAGVLLVACALPAVAQPAQPPAAVKRPFEIDLPLPAQEPVARPATPPPDFLLGHAPRVNVDCRNEDGISYAALQPGQNRCTARIAPTLLVLQDTVAYYAVRAYFVKERGLLFKDATPGHADVQGLAVFDGQGAAADFTVRAPDRARVGNAIALELLGAAAANVNLGITAVANRAGIPVPLQPPDWGAVKTAAVNIASQVRQSQADRLRLVGVLVRVWLCNPRKCTPPADVSLAIGS